MMNFSPSIERSWEKNLSLRQNNLLNQLQKSLTNSTVTEKKVVVLCLDSITSKISYSPKILHDTQRFF